MASDVRPTLGELEEARAIVEITLDSVERELPDGLEGLQVGLGWMDDPLVTEDFGGAIAVCDGPERIRVMFTAGVEDWTDAVMAATARGSGQAWLRGTLPDERLAFQWQAVLASAAGIVLASQVAPSTATPWADAERLADTWTVLQSHLADSVETGDVFANQETPAYPIESLGACLAEVTELRELPEMTQSDVVDRLEEAVTKT